MKELFITEIIGRNLNFNLIVFKSIRGKLESKLYNYFFEEYNFFMFELRNSLIFF